MSRNKSMYNKGDGLLLDENLRNSNFGRLHSLFTNLALNRFKWEGLPPSIKPRHIENALHSHGACFIFDHHEYGLICLPCYSNGKLNIYGEPTHVTVIGHGESIGDYPVKDGVRIMNNDLSTPTKLSVLYYANAIAQTDKTMYKNLKKLKNPYIVATTKENELTYKNLLKQIEEDKDEIFVDNRLTQGGNLGIEVLNTNVPYLIDKLQAHKNDLVNEFLTIMGLNNTNANNNKKERLLVDEVNVNNGEILMYLDIDYKNRDDACKEIKEKFNLDVKVTKNIENLSEIFMEGGDKNGEIHNRSKFPFIR